MEHITDTLPIPDHLETVFQHHEKQLNGKAGNQWHTFQRQSFDELKRVMFPGKKHEDWKYTSVQRLIAPSFQLAMEETAPSVPSIPGFDTYVLTVINGRLQPESFSSPGLAETGLRILPLDEAMAQPSWKTNFQPLLNYAAASPNRAFELLNFAFAGNGFVLVIGDGQKLEKPIEIRILHDGPESTFSHPLYFVHAGKGSHCAIIERFEKNAVSPFPEAGGLINALSFYRLERNATVQHLKWQDLPLTQNLVYKLLALQHRDSHLTTLAFDRGGQMVRNNIEVELEEPNTYTSIQAGFLATGTQSMDHQTRINHKVPHGESHELYKGIIDHQASAAFNGKVYVHPDAQKTNAYQQNDALVLSPNAIMNSKPQLEIFADDVRCSHGATIGQLDEKALFYLQSRGIHPEAARHMLKEAFLATVMEAIPEEAPREFIRHKMIARI